MTIREIIVDELEKAIESGANLPTSFELRIPIEFLELMRKESGTRHILNFDDLQITVRDDLNRDPRL